MERDALVRVLYSLLYALVDSDDMIVDGKQLSRREMSDILEDLADKFRY